MALPTGTQMTKRGVLTAQPYSQFQVSNGVGGNALAEVQAKFPVSQQPELNLPPYPNTPPNLHHPDQREQPIRRRRPRPIHHQRSAQDRRKRRDQSRRVQRGHRRSGGNQLATGQDPPGRQDQEQGTQAEAVLAGAADRPGTGSRCSCQAGRYVEEVEQEYRA